MTSKTCNTCETEKPLEQFNLSGGGKRRNMCNVCFNNTHNTKTNPERMYMNGVYVPKTHPLWKPGRYVSPDNNAYDVSAEDGKPVHGYVYIITNDAWPEWVKIGMADDAEKRLRGYQTCSPMRDYHLYEFYEVNDRRAAETAAHKILHEQYKRRREWFRCSPQAADLLIRGTMGEFADE